MRDIVGAAVERDIVGAMDTLARECDQTLRAAGVVGRAIVRGDVVGYEFALPSQRGIIRARAFVAPPVEVGDDDEVGRRGRRAKRKARRRARRKKILRGLKKVAKSKALRALAQVAKSAASIIPGGGAVTTALETASKAAKAVRVARNVARRTRDGRLLRALPGAIRQGASEVRRARALLGR